MRKSLLVLAVLLTGVIAALIVASVNPSTSVAQNTNSSQPATTNKNENRSVTPQQPSGGGAQQQQDFSKNTWELPDDADQTKNPVTATAESIAKGKELYHERTKGNCVFCHGETGSGNEANLARLRRKPADISSKERMAAMTDGELFWKVSKGITGIMPAGGRRMTEEERWHVVNYIRTLPKAE